MVARPARAINGFGLATLRHAIPQRTPNDVRLRQRVQGIEEAIAVAEEGSLVAASRRLGVTASALGKAVASLEDRLGIRLFQRTTRSVALTEEGRRYLERCRSALAELDAGDAELDDGTDRVAGLIRLGAPVAFGRLHVVPHLHAFAEAHPDVRFDVRLTDRVIDPLQARLDLVVRIGELPDSGMRARPFMRVALGAFGAPGLLERLGSIEHPDDLLAHPRLEFVMTNGQRLEHAFERDGERVVLPACDRLRCDDAEGVLAAAVAGMGVCYLPTFLARPEVDAGRLRPVLPEWAIDRYPVHLLTPSPTKVPRRIVRLVDHLIARANDDPGKHARSA